MDCLDAVISHEARTGGALREHVRRALTAIRKAHLEHEAEGRLRRRGDATACWIRAALLEERGLFPEANVLYAKVVDSAGCEVPETLIQRARIAARSGQLSQAEALLRFAFRLNPDYALLSRSEALVRKLVPHVLSDRQVRVAILGSSTTSLLKSTIASLFFRDKIEVSFYESTFGGFEQDVLDQHSALYRFAPEVVLIALNWRDCGIGFFSEKPQAAAESCALRFTTLWKTLLNRCNCQIIQPSFLPPPDDPFLNLSSQLPQGRARILRNVNQHLFSEAPPSVTMLDTERISAQHPGLWEDKIKWSTAKLYPAPDALPLLAGHIVSIVRANLGLSAKVLALDLDNTLWGGVIGEDGLAGISLGPPSATGERFQDFQRYLKGLKDRGILLAAISKNNAADAESVFRRHDSSVLTLDDFTAFVANWEPKCENIQKIAASLQLGLDRFVFLDDNPAERAAVRDTLPEVIVPEITSDPVSSIQALERGLYFQAITLTGEDRARVESYAARRHYARVRDEEGDPVQMESVAAPVDETSYARATQLINKTNQFNLTNRRYTLEQVMAFSCSSKHWLRSFRMSDRFADHGLVGILLAEKSDPETWNIDLWLLSCRVIGRGLEKFMFNSLLEAARQESVKTLTATYVPSQKNGLVSNLLNQFGFTQMADDRLTFARHTNCATYSDKPFPDRAPIPAHP